MGRVSSKEDLLLLPEACPSLLGVSLLRAQAQHWPLRFSICRHQWNLRQLSHSLSLLCNSGPCLEWVGLFSKRNKLLELTPASNETSNVLNSTSFPNFSYFLQEGHLELQISPYCWKLNGAILHINNEYVNKHLQFHII